jgi:hypothetical protein
LADPTGVAVDDAGNIFIADSANSRVVELPAGGAKQTTVGSGFVFPAAVAVDAAGDVFIADLGANEVFEVPAGGSQQVEVGSGWSGPGGVSVDAAGDLFVSEYLNNSVVELPAGGGTEITLGAGLLAPFGVFADAAGNVFIADTDNNRVLELPRSQPPALSFAATKVGATSADSPQTVVVQNIGNKPLPLSGVAYSADFPEGSAQTGMKLCTDMTKLPAGGTCEVSVDFTPLKAGVLSENVKITDDALNLTGATQSIALKGTSVAANTVATMTSPTAGSTLTGPSVTFTWTNTSATQYYLSVGSTGVGSTNVYNSGWRTVTSWVADPLPTNGETLYVRLSTDLSGTVVYNDYTYKASTQAAVTSPTAGSILTGPSVTFNWSAATGATQYYLSVGSTGVGSTNVYNSGWRDVTSWTATGLPANGETVYVRLSTDYSGIVAHADYTYIAASPAVLTTPTPGSTLSGSSVTFDWKAGTTGATQYYLSIGSTGVGSSNIYNSGWRDVTSWEATGLPTNGEALYVRLSTDFGGAVVHNDYTYTAH